MTDLVCQSGIELLNDYVEDALPPDLRATLDAHVARCPRCAAFIESYQAVPHIFREATRSDMPPALSVSMRAFLRRPEER